MSDFFLVFCVLFSSQTITNNHKQSHTITQQKTNRKQTTPQHQIRGARWQTFHPPPTPSAGTRCAPPPLLLTLLLLLPAALLTSFAFRAVWRKGNHGSAQVLPESPQEHNPLLRNRQECVPLLPHHPLCPSPSPLSSPSSFPPFNPQKKKKKTWRLTMKQLSGPLSSPTSRCCSPGARRGDAL